MKQSISAKMSRDDSFDTDDIYDFDYLKDNSWETLARPKVKPKTNQDNRIKLPPVLVGRNIVAENHAKMAAISNGKVHVAAKIEKEKDWHKERMKLKGPRQPQKEVFNPEKADKRVFLPRCDDIEKPRFHSKLPKIDSTMPNLTEAPTIVSKTPYPAPVISQRKIYDNVSKGIGHPIFPDPRPSKRGENDIGLSDRLIDDIQDEKIHDAVAATRKNVYIVKSSQPSVFDKDYLTPEEKKAAAKYDFEKELGIKFSSDGSVQNDVTKPKVPKPPTAPKPTETTNFSRGRRRLRYKEDIEDTGLQDADRKDATDKVQMADTPVHPRQRRSVRFTKNSELNQNVSVHNDPKDFHRARPNTPYFVDYNKEVNEGIILKRKFEKVNQALQKSKSNGFEAENYLSSLDDILESPRESPIEMRPMTAALANKNEAGSTTAMPFKQVQPQLRAEPICNWDGEIARRGVGFKSKFKDEDASKGEEFSANLPEKIRRQMKKYLN